MSIDFIANGINFKIINNPTSPNLYSWEFHADNENYYTDGFFRSIADAQQDAINYAAKFNRLRARKGD